MKQKQLKPAAGVKAKLKPKAAITKFRPQVRSRHKTHDIIRGVLPLFSARAIIRLGSTTPLGAIYPKGVNGKVVEINTVEAVKNSANKLLMKECFTRAGVRTAPWYVAAKDTFYKVVGLDDKGNVKAEKQPISFPVVSKHIFGSRGTGNKFHHDEASLQAWMKGKDLSKYILEEYFSGVREYRLHVSKNGCFYTCRKMLKQDTPQEERWYRNDDNSVWIMDTNPNFDKPVNWGIIVGECVKALNAVGLDVGAFDVRVQSTKNSKGAVRESPAFIILESNSAPSFGDVTTERYKEELPKLIQDKLV